MPDPSLPIGVFDSGIGGLAVLAEVRRLLPNEDLIYYADTAYFPYGPRPREQVRERADAITRELLDLGSKIIVVACNTATSAAVAHLRETYPETPFVSIEPALKPAAERTLAGRVALLVTPGTAAGEKLAALIDRYGHEVSVHVIPAPGLAEAIEEGSAEVSPLVERFAAATSATGADVLALGCTHYAFVKESFEQALGQGIVVIEPSEAVARQVQRVLAGREQLRGDAAPGGVRYLTSGAPARFAEARERLRRQGIVLPDDAPAPRERV